VPRKTTMITVIGDIRERLSITPFRPFRIRLADGHEYPVPTIDHIYLPPGGGRVVVTTDEGIVVVLPATLVSGILCESDSPELV
jgi:hypothetical protein